MPFVNNLGNTKTNNYKSVRAPGKMYKEKEVPAPRMPDSGRVRSISESQPNLGLTQASTTQQYTPGAESQNKSKTNITYNDKGVPINIFTGQPITSPQMPSAGEFPQSAYTPAPTATRADPWWNVAGQQVVPELPAGASELDLINWNMQLAQNALNTLLPGIQSAMSQPVAGYTLPEYQSLPQSALPQYYDILSALEGFSPDAQSRVTSSTYNAPTFLESPGYTPGSFVANPEYAAPGFTGAPEFTPSRFYETKPIMSDILNDPSFKAFESQLEEATGRKSESIADEMARRGILSSGTSQQAFTDLGEANARAIASKMGEIASPLLQKSALQQAIYDPIRKTEFEDIMNQLGYKAGAAEAGRQTSFDVTQALQGLLAGERGAGRQTDYNVQSARDMYNAALESVGSRRDFEGKQAVLGSEAENKAIANLLGLAQGQTGSMQDQYRRIADLSRQDFDRLQARKESESLLPMQNQAMENELLGKLAGFFNAAITGQQPAISGATGALDAIQRRLDTEAGRQATARQQEETRSSNDLSSWLQFVGSALPTVASGAKSVYNWMS